MNAKKKKRPWFVYILRCKGNVLYTGITSDLERRTREHKSGHGCRFTRCRVPVKLLYHELVPTMSAALKREAAIKCFSREKKLALIRGVGQGKADAAPSRRGAMRRLTAKNFDSPEEVRLFVNGRIDLIKIAGMLVGRATFYPGWKWSKSVKSIAGTKSCQVAHFQYHVSGRLRVRMDSGLEKEFGQGDVSVMPPGHDAWVVGDEPVVLVDFQGLARYAKKA